MNRLIIFLFACAQLYSEAFPARYEGAALYEKVDVNISLAYIFLPYNPVILEAGAYCGDQTSAIAKRWPLGKVYAFEPNPRAYALLKTRIATEGLKNVTAYPEALCNYTGHALLYLCHGTTGQDPIFESASSLYKPTDAMAVHLQGPVIQVPTRSFAEWYAQAHLNRVDMMVLELEGMELQVLKSAPEILKTVKVIYTNTYFFPFRIGMTYYPELETFLESQGFRLLMHAYREGLSGTAIFLQTELFDAYFKHSLGMDY